MPGLLVGGASVCLEVEAVTPPPCHRAAGKAAVGTTGEVKGAKK